MMSCKEQEEEEAPKYVGLECVPMGEKVYPCFNEILSSSSFCSSCSSPCSSSSPFQGVRGGFSAQHRTGWQNSIQEDIQVSIQSFHFTQKPQKESSAWGEKCKYKETPSEEHSDYCPHHTCLEVLARTDGEQCCALQMQGIFKFLPIPCQLCACKQCILIIGTQGKYFNNKFIVLSANSGVWCWSLTMKPNR